jgi:hypothetical protein
MMTAKTPKTKSQSTTCFQKIVTGSFYMKGLLTTVLLTVLLAGNLVAQATDQTVKSEGLTVSSATRSSQPPTPPEPLGHLNKKQPLPAQKSPSHHPIAPT